MKTIPKEYSILFNEITDASKDLAQLNAEITKVLTRLMHAQQRTEEMFLEYEIMEEKLKENLVERSCCKY